MCGGFWPLTSRDWGAILANCSESRLAPPVFGPHRHVFRFRRSRRRNLPNAPHQRTEHAKTQNGGVGVGGEVTKIPRKIVPIMPRMGLHKRSSGQKSSGGKQGSGRIELHHKASVSRSRSSSPLRRCRPGERRKSSCRRLGNRRSAQKRTARGEAGGSRKQGWSSVTESGGEAGSKLSASRTGTGRVRRVDRASYAPWRGDRA
jgi:hypothetical protein